MNPKVSILIPVYNVSKYIERCAISAFEQTYDNLEFVFINDCTKDDSIHILEDVLKRYPSRQDNCRIINHEVNRGLSAARNTGLVHCTGDFIVHVDSDDFMELNAIEILVRQQQHSNADIVSGMVVMHTLSKDVLLPHPTYQSREEMVLDMMQMTINHSIWRRLIRKSLYDNYQITAKEGVNCGEDCWAMTRLAYYAKSFDTVDKVVYHYDCTRDDSYMASKKGVLNKKRIQDDIATAELIIGFFKDKEPVYLDEANRVAIKYNEMVLKQAASVNDFGLYDEMRSRIKAFDHRYWDAIGWDNGLKRTVLQNYITCRMSLFLSRVYHKIQSYKYK